MSKGTASLRALLVLIVFVMAVACGGLYLVSLESARSWPELAHLRLRSYVAAVAGVVPILVALRCVFELLSVVDQGEAFSARAVALLRQLMVLIAVFAAYYTCALLAFWAWTGLIHLSLVVAWFAIEVAALFFFATAALLARLFDAALQLRQDNELTV